MYIDNLNLKDKIINRVQEEVDVQKISNEKIFLDEIINNVFKEFSIDRLVQILEMDEENFENTSLDLKKRIAEKIYNIEFQIIKDEIYSNINIR